MCFYCTLTHHPVSEENVVCDSFGRNFDDSADLLEMHTVKYHIILIFPRSLFIALFRHILNVGQKGCYRTALELCKLLLNLSPDDDPLAVSLMIDFYALRAQEYSWLVALYDTYEPTKNLSMVSTLEYIY